jgi:RimJ/RimL family protein N-acetyltransferase
VTAVVDAAGRPVAPVEGEGVRLRPFRDADTDALIRGLADPEVRRFLPLLPDPYGPEDARAWIEVQAPAAFAHGLANFAVADPATDELIGGIGLDHGTRDQAEVGYWVAPWARRRGVATAAVRALSGWAFGRGLARLELLTDWSNAASQRVALGAGFTREGVRRGAGRTRDGSRHDFVVFARLAHDPPGPALRLLPDLPGGELSDGVVTLRPLEGADAAFLTELARLPDVVATSVPPVAPDPAELTVRCARAAARWLAGERADLVIQDTATGEPTGEIGLYFVEPATGQAMIGYSMLPGWRGRGYPTRAVQLLALWVFAETGIARLIAGTLPTNAASQRVLAKAGFRREALLRSRLPGPAGTRVDDVQYALLAEDLLAAAAQPGYAGPASDRIP